MVEGPTALERQHPADARRPHAGDSDLSLLAQHKQDAQPAEHFPTTLQPGKTTEQSVGTGFEKRSYDVHVPKNWDGKSPVPVMYYFNGMRNDGTREPEDFTGLSDQSDKKGFAVVYMHGSNDKTQTYNNGQKLFANNHDENAYLNAIHNSLAKQLPLDETRQGLTGFSQGGSEAYDLAAKNKWVASAQSVEGYMTGYEPKLNHAVSEQNIHALHDSIIPENGTDQECGMADRAAKNDMDMAKYTGEIAFDPMQLFHAAVCEVEKHGDMILPQRATVDAFKTADGITGNGQVSKNIDYSIYDFKNAKNGAEVKQITLNEGSHGWAGSKDHSGDMHFMNIGVPNMKVDAGKEVADFFMNHPLIKENE